MTPLAELVNHELRVARDSLDAATNQEAVWGACQPYPAVLRAIAEARDTLRSVEHNAVLGMRQQGSSWDEIGDALGVSRQAAQKKYGR